jgi:hypothetical protein
MKTGTSTAVRATIDRLLDKVLDSGLFLEARRGQRRWRLVCAEPLDKLQITRFSSPFVHA